jgi:hypothetical protein
VHHGLVDACGEPVAELRRDPVRAGTLRHVDHEQDPRRAEPLDLLAHAGDRAGCEHHARRGRLVDERLHGRG